jgi:RHS repeat-associated protein
MRVVTDGGGRLVEERDYLPFGSERLRLRGDDFGLDPNLYAFQDRELQEGTGLYHMTRRFYLSDLGSFVSVDPKSLVPEMKRAPRIRNAYAYGNANPLAYVDSAGLEGVWFDGSAGINVQSKKGSKTTGGTLKGHIYEDSVGDRIRLKQSIGKGKVEARIGGGTAKVVVEAAATKTEISAKIMEGVRASAYAGLGAGFEAGIDTSRGKRIAKVKGWLLVGAKVEVDMTGLGVLDGLPEDSPVRTQMDGFRRAMSHGAGVAIGNEVIRLSEERSERADRERRRIYDDFDRHVKRTQLEEFTDEILGSQEGYEEWLWLQEQGYDPDFSSE